MKLGAWRSSTSPLLSSSCEEAATLYSGFHQGSRTVHIVVCQGSFGQYQVGFLGFGYTYGAGFRRATFLEVFRVEEVEPGQGLEVRSVKVFLYGAYHTVVSVVFYLLYEVFRQGQRFVGILYGVRFIAQPIIGTGYQGVDEYLFFGIDRVIQCLCKT